MLPARYDDDDDDIYIYIGIAYTSDYFMFGIIL